MFSIQNYTVEQLTKEYGSPLYVYDGQIIENQVRKIKEAFVDVDVKIKYACKANTNISVLSLMRKLGVELDVVSPQEMRLGFAAGYKPEQIMYTSSGVSFDEIEDAVSNNVLINIDNLPTLKMFGQKYGNSFPCTIRIRPNVVGGGNVKIMTGHPDAKFGIAIEQKEEILSIVEKYNINIVGLHQHTGSDIKDGNTFVEVAQILLNLAFDFPNLQFIDYGGGFKVAYKEGDVVTNMTDLGEKLSKSFNEFCEKYGKKLQLWFEPGKFLVSECGYLLATANIVKENPRKTLIGLNTGLNHLIRPMMYDAYHDVFNGTNTDLSQTEKYDVVGYICETDDIAKERNLAKTQAGDIIVIKNAGAYGFSMASNYNSRFRPAEVLIYKNQAHLIRKRETMDDILKNQVLVEL